MTTEDAKIWSQVGDRSVFVSDLVDQATVSEAKMAVGSCGPPRGEALDVSFPNDEVVYVANRPRCHRRCGDDAAGIQG